MRTITVGEIYGLNLDKNDGITPKYGYNSRYKFCVVVGCPDYGYYVAYLIVDHEINEKFNNTRLLKDNFFPIKRSDYPNIILEKYDPSWVDMTEIREMTAERIVNEGTLLGQLTDKDLELILSTLKDSRLLSPKTKRRIGLID